jgi:hypothetical protein
VQLRVSEKFNLIKKEEEDNKEPKALLINRTSSTKHEYETRMTNHRYSFRGSSKGEKEPLLF